MIGGSGGGAGSGGGTEVGGGAGGPTNIDGSETNGGGGAAFGGAVFVQAGGTLTIGGSGTFSGGSLTGGTGYTNGAAAGSDLFIMTGTTTTLAPGTGNTLIFNGSVADDSASSVPSGQGYTPGTAAGGSITIGSSNSPGGTVIFNGVNTYSGGTIINSGTLEFAAPTSMPAVGTVSVNSGGTVAIFVGATGFTNATSGNGSIGGLFSGLGGQAGSTVTLANGSSVGIDTSNGSATYAGNITNSGVGLTKLGANTLTLTGNNTYSGTTLISAGTLTFTNSTSGLTGTMIDNSAVVFNQSGNSSFNQAISGAGSLTQTGTGTLILSGANTYSGPTLISSGTLNFTGSTAGLTGIITNNSAVVFNQGASSSFNQAISGSGSLTQSGTGTLTLSGANTYSGGTTIQSGTLQIGNGGITGSIVGNVSDNGTLAFDHSDSFTFSGIISGSGTLTQLGSGMLTLTGANTYSGGTSLQNGTLVLSSNQALGSGPLTANDPTIVYMNGVTLSNSIILNGPTTLEVDNSDSANQVGVISGTSGISKVGTGFLTLSASNTFSGGTNLNAGTLVIANANGLGNSSVSVNGGTLMTDGINHSININGNYTQTGGSLALTITSPTVYDQLIVSGHATVGGTLALNLLNGGAPGSGQKFALIKSSQPVSGQFSAVTPNLPSIGATLVYSNSVTLQAQVPPVPTPTPGTYTPPPTPIVASPTPQVTLYQKAFGDLYGNYLSPNENGAASYVDSQDQNIKNASFGNLVSALNQISPNENGLRAAFDQLNPLKFHSFAASTAFNNAPFLIQQFDDYLASHRSEKGGFIGSNGGIDDSGLVINDPTIDPGLQTVHSHLMAFNNGASSPAPDGKDLKSLIAPEPETNQWNAFASGSVILGQDYSVSQSGLANSDITSENVQIGADYRLSPNWLAGVTFGYGHSGANLDSIGSAAYVDTYSPGVYAAYSKGNWYANGLANYGFNNYTQHRNVQIGPFDGTATSKPTGNQFVINSDGGYDFHQGHWTFGPTTGLDYVHLDINGYSESGLPGADLNVKEDQSDSLRSLLGGHVSYSFTGEGVTFTSHLNASWQHEFFDAARNITSQFNDLSVGAFTARTANPSRESALIDAGLDAQITKSISLFTNYTVQAGQENYFGQSVQAGIKFGF